MNIPQILSLHFSFIFLCHIICFFNILIFLLFPFLHFNCILGVISFFSLCVCVFSLSVMSDFFVTPQTVARQVPLSIEFPRQEYWSGLPFSSSGDLPDPEIKPASPALHVDSLPLSHQRSTKLRYLIAKKC